ncbi:MAG: peptidoglycan-binding protein [Myxococcaceae bacterium]|nr:peptidoglycan-binding protein [Myxococcaceae bacterium]
MRPLPLGAVPLPSSNLVPAAPPPQLPGVFTPSALPYFTDGFDGAATSGAAVTSSSGGVPAAPAQAPSLEDVAKRGAVIRSGEHGQSVRKLQQLLDAGLEHHKVPVTGTFGPALTKAVTTFQKKHHLTPTGNVNKGTLTAIRHAASSGRGSDAVKVAHGVLGHNIAQLERSGPLARYLDNTNSHVSCANFVSACLQKAGLISAGQHSDLVTGLAQNLGHDPQWKKVSSHGLKPGDVVCFEVPGEGHMAHVELYAGHGQFIGSNNVNPDGSQRISQGHVGYHIDAVYRYAG